MRRLACCAAMMLLGVTAGIRPATSTASAQTAADRPLVTAAQLERWQTELSNWGRWGTDDDKGALNLITPSKRKAAMSLVRDGVSVSLSAATVTQKTDDVPNPVEWAMTNVGETGSGDRVNYPGIHGAAHTHIDAFAHQFVGGRMFNGHQASQNVTMQGGAAKGSVVAFKEGIITRGVLYDIPRLKGVPYLEPGTRIFPEDMEAWERKTGARVGSGDALIIRWGRWAREARIGPYRTNESAAGFDNSILPWLKRRDVAVIAWETPDYTPKPAGDLPRNVVHNFVNYRLGMLVIDRGNYEALAETAAARNRWEFLLMVAPLVLDRATGSPVNPIAVF